MGLKSLNGGEFIKLEFGNKLTIRKVFHNMIVGIVKPIYYNAILA